MTAPDSRRIRLPSLRGAIPGWLLLLGALTAIGPLSVDMYLPSLPTIARDLKTSSAAAGITLTAFLISLAIGQLIYGPASDRFGRKPPLYIGLALYVAASIGCAFAADAGTLALLRAVQGFGGCAGMVISRAAVRDRMDPAGAAQAYSTLMLVMGVAPILAPMIGGAVLQVTAWRMIFAVLATFGVLSLAAVHFQMRESLDPAHVRPLAAGRVLRDYWELLRDRHYAAPMVCGAVFVSGMFAYITVSPFVLIDHYGLSPAQYAWVFGSNAAGMIAASRINVRLVHRFSPAGVLRRALWIPVGTSVAAAVAVAAGFTPLPLVLAALFCYVASIGCISPNTGALAMAGQGARAGTGSALMGAMQFGLGMVTGTVVAAIGQDAAPLLGMMAVCAVLALGLGLRATQPGHGN
ncbi:multidrug effflux MFS transporter [Ralstonia solanacearum]|uniref:multidrug effflux MFS transporter n=1 Tax=Ralstonia solanacearum TaxID=305 RepID=UPI001144C1AD|nr:multidrug effflux MFS transporter [Ralstonia solanacearum]MBT1538645.1 multidrug effflux MFS transporter [Ralstonia solanacearum]QOK81841.1 multidrug effflux MFS transporter [Ralstonia solanacearum]